MAFLTEGAPRPHLARWILVWGCLAGPLAGKAWAQQTPGELEQQVKAAYLLNFTRYVDWPPGTFPDPETPVNLCVLAPDRFGEIVRQTVAGRRSRGREVRVVVPDTPAQAADCHVAFLAGPGSLLREWLSALERAPALTVGDGAEFLNGGGAIAFVIREQTVRFEIDQSAVRRAGLQMSSRVLSLATRLHGTPPDSQ